MAQGGISEEIIPTPYENALSSGVAGRQLADTDRLMHAAFAQLTNGLSPVVGLQAWLDWASHTELG